MSGRDYDDEELEAYAEWFEDPSDILLYGKETPWLEKFHNANGVLKERFFNLLSQIPLPYFEKFLPTTPPPYEEDDSDYYPPNFLSTRNPPTYPKLCFLKDLGSVGHETDNPDLTPPVEVATLVTDQSLVLTTDLVCEASSDLTEASFCPSPASSCAEDDTDSEPSALMVYEQHGDLVRSEVGNINCSNADCLCWMNGICVKPRSSQQLEIENRNIKISRPITIVESGKGRETFKEIDWNDDYDVEEEIAAWESGRLSDIKLYNHPTPLVDNLAKTTPENAVPEIKLPPPRPLTITEVITLSSEILFEKLISFMLTFPIILEIIQLYQSFKSEINYRITLICKPYHDFRENLNQRQQARDARRFGLSDGLTSEEVTALATIPDYPTITHELTFDAVPSPSIREVTDKSTIPDEATIVSGYGPAENSEPEIPDMMQRFLDMQSRFNGMSTRRRRRATQKFFYRARDRVANPGEDTDPNSVSKMKPTAKMKNNVPDQRTSRYYPPVQRVANIVHHKDIRQICVVKPTTKMKYEDQIPSDNFNGNDPANGLVSWKNLNLETITKPTTKMKKKNHGLPLDDPAND